MHRRLWRFDHDRNGFRGSSGTHSCRRVGLGASRRRLRFWSTRTFVRGWWGSLRNLKRQAEESQSEGEGEESNRASHDVGHTPLDLMGPNFRTDHFDRSGYQVDALVALGAYEQGLPERP